MTRTRGKPMVNPLNPPKESSTSKKNNYHRDSSSGITFYNEKCYDCYLTIKDKPLIVERKLVDSTRFEGVVEYVKSFNLGNIFDGHGKAYEGTVREFYANIHGTDDHNLSFKTMVGKTVIDVNCDLIASLTGLSKQGIALPRPVDSRPTNEQLSMTLIGREVPWGWKFPTEDLSIELKAFGKLGVANICPSMMVNSVWSHDFAELVYYLRSGREINLCDMIIYQMRVMTRNGKNLGFPCLIGRICDLYNVKPSGKMLGEPQPLIDSSICKMLTNVNKRKNSDSQGDEESSHSAEETQNNSNNKVVSLLHTIIKRQKRLEDNVTCLQ